MQSVEESKPRVGVRKSRRRSPSPANGPQLSNISWLADVLVYSSSIIPVVMGPVVFITAFSAAVAAASVVFGKHVELTNNVGEWRQNCGARQHSPPPRRHLDYAKGGRKARNC